MLLGLAILGIALNVVSLIDGLSEAHDGAQGAEIMFLLCFVPYVVFGFWLHDKIS